MKFDAHVSVQPVELLLACWSVVLQDPQRSSHKSVRRHWRSEGLEAFLYFFRERANLADIFHALHDHDHSGPERLLTRPQPARRRARGHRSLLHLPCHQDRVPVRFRTPSRSRLCLRRWCTPRPRPRASKTLPTFPHATILSWTMIHRTALRWTQPARIHLARTATAREGGGGAGAVTTFRPTAARPLAQDPYGASALQRLAVRGCSGRWVHLGDLLEITLSGSPPNAPKRAAR